MSKSESVNLTCKKCGKQSDFVIWQSINTSVNPEMKKAVLDGTLFRYRCPTCGEEALVPYPCLYHQMEDLRMFWMIGGAPENSLETAERLFLDIKQDGAGYLCRIVPTIAQLIEKIKIFDAGYDDRLIEFVKFCCLVSLRDREKDIEVDRVLFEPKGTKFVDVAGEIREIPVEEDRIDFFNKGVPICSMSYDARFFEQTAKEISARGGPEDEAGFIIDNEWALNWIESEMK